MRTANSWFSLVGALFPVLFFGGLFLYLSGVNNAFYGLLDGAMGPTRMGLGALTILFAFLFLWKLRRLSTPPAPRAGTSLDEVVEEQRSDFDADAAMARYLARRSGAPDAPPATFGEAPPVRPAGSFGRKGT